ncbi:MAG: L-fucose/L-arabinose isomerase family protein [Syntrophaceae bacterium]|nr:L-fucose/L-arabinose isomerase family protein [Syntrophaceae bacterium]
MKKTDQKILLGYAPTITLGAFSKEKGIENKIQIRDLIKSWNMVEMVDIEDVAEDGFLPNLKTLDKVVKKFRDSNVDAIFVPHCNFGTEYAVTELARAIGKPLLIWGPQDTAPGSDGRRLTDTLCGLLATSRVLVSANVPFSYIVNSKIGSKVFEKGFKTFIGASAVVKTFRNLKVGQVGVRPPNFWTMKVNERELMEKFGIKTETLDMLEVGNQVQKTADSNSSELKKIIKKYKERAHFADIVSDEQIKMMAALHIVLSDWMLENELDAACFRCWSSFQDVFKIMPCFMAGNLIDEGLPLICEVDLHGAISAALTRAATLWKKPIFFPDVTARHPENPHGVLMWHCGPFPPSLCRKTDEVKVGRHPVLEPLYFSGCGHFELQEGPVSIVRFEGTNGIYKLFAGQARTCEGPMTQGTYVWVEMNDWSKWEEKLIRGPYLHHVAAIYEHISPVLYEATRFMPGVEPDMLDPEAGEIEKWLKSEN